MGNSALSGPLSERGAVTTRTTQSPSLPQSPSLVTIGKIKGENPGRERLCSKKQKKTTLYLTSSCQDIEPSFIFSYKKKNPLVIFLVKTKSKQFSTYEQKKKFNMETLRKTRTSIKLFDLSIFFYHALY